MTREPSDYNFENVLAKFRQNPEYKKQERRLKPYTDILVQIVTRRDELKLTQKDLAEKANTYQSRISKIESGNYDIRMSTLIEVAEALGCEVSVQLVPFEEGPIDIGEYAPLFSNPIKAEQGNPFPKFNVDVDWTC